MTCLAQVTGSTQKLLREWGDPQGSPTAIGSGSSGCLSLETRSIRELQGSAPVQGCLEENSSETPGTGTGEDSESLALSRTVRRPLLEL